VDGVDLTVQVNGHSILSTSFNGHYDMKLTNVVLQKGDVVDVIVGTNATVAGGDGTTYRVQIYKTG
jgi:hypothetical protein